MAYIRLFQDPFFLHDSLISSLNKADLRPQPGDTIVIGAKQLTIEASTLPGDYNYVLVAEKLSVAGHPSGPLMLTGTDLNKSPSIMVLADQIQGVLNLACMGETGRTGARGTPGGSKWVVEADPRGNNILVNTPKPGGRGGQGGDGAPSGNVTVNYCTASDSPVTSAAGGKGGEGGPGGPGGLALQPDGSVKHAPTGPQGPPGGSGAPGRVAVREVHESNLWDLLDPDSALQWVAYLAKGNAFKEIVATFNGCDLDGDGGQEIQLLRMLPFEDPSEQVDPNNKLVVVLVESRLFDDIPDAKYSADDIRDCLKRFKSDLQAEGFQSRFLQATVYAEAGQTKRQDGKTLLSIREFFKVTRSIYSKFEGAILVGSFPEARLTQFYPCHKQSQHDGRVVDSYLMDGFNWVYPRYDIVLADLNGNWRDIYHEKVELNRYKFIVTDQTFSYPAPDNSEVLLEDPQIVLNDGDLKTPVTAYDTFFIKDTAFNVNKNWVEFSLLGANPEVADENKSRPNPIATPTICVSRINARSIAVQPPAGALDASGKPQATTAVTDFSPEKWVRDPKLERTLLVKYFDRNHSFRSGKFADQPFSVSVLESADYGTSDAYTGLDGMQYTNVETRNATLLDAIQWLKKPAPFRVVSSHASFNYTELKNESDEDAATAENEAGGHPWNWVQDHSGSYVPSFKGDSAANLCLYRTLWENGELENICPSLLLHVGCDVNAIADWGQDPDLWPGPYCDPAYGRFQNSESLLFYGNQLAVLCHVHHWNQGPRGFGNAFGSSPTATFGDGWKGFSDAWSRDGTLLTNQLDRKRSYEWNIVGDWTLRKYYPAPGRTGFSTGMLGAAIIR